MINTDSTIKISILSNLFNLRIKGGDKLIKNLGSMKSSAVDMLSFAENEEFLKIALENKNVVAIVVTEKISNIKTSKTLLLSDHPRETFYNIHNYLLQKKFYEVKQKSIISEKAIIHKSAYIAVNNVIIGNNVNVGPHVSILENTTIDDNVTIHANSVIGEDGFQNLQLQNNLISISHGGGVHIQSDVRIGANTCIDKGLFKDDTIIGKGTKIDNLVHIAHNVKIGKNCSIVANVFVGGSCIIEDNVRIAMSATLRDGIKIGRNSIIGMGSVVTSDVSENITVMGVPAKPFNKNLK